MKIRVQNGEVVLTGIPPVVRRWLASETPAKASPLKLSAAAQLRQVRIEGIRAGAAEGGVWFWLAVSGAATLAVSLWF